MATSGSTDWSRTRDEIIQDILEICGMIAVGATPSAALVTMVSTHLNKYIKFLQVNDWVKLWKLNWTQKVFASAASEVTATDDTIWTCIVDHTSSSTTKPITGAEHTTYWAQRGDTGGTWVDATAYTSTGQFADSADIIGVESAFLRKDGTDRPITIIGHKEYMEIANKTSEGSPTHLYFDNKVSPKIYLYPHLDDIDDVIHYQQILRIEDFDNAADDPDFPVHWIEPITWNVAKRVAAGPGQVAIRRLQEIKSIAKETLEGIIGSTQETAGNLEISPDLMGYY